MTKNSEFHSDPTDGNPMPIGQNFLVCKTLSVKV